MPTVAALQDLLVHAVKGVGYWADLSRAVGGKDEEIDRFVIDALVNGDSTPDALAARIAEANRLHKKAKDLFEKNNGRAFSGFVPAPGKPWDLPEDREEQVKLGQQYGAKDPRVRPEVHAVRQEILKGVKGYAALVRDARARGKESEEIIAFTHQTLANLINDRLDKDENTAIALEVDRISGIAKGLLK